ncbi:xylan 1,4-beta-xylosidase [Nocardiopsis terrae]|uniref:Xylan 1,4-beta-xylosidase n=1 Tax=Nocardiopsis terrae TaxID=372655 RepID=A0ABR9HDR2_9ACTN|nr:glycoside hydrolase family 43 protein [Nocardiopsis terrae]MBE1457167.1 xylan 1,4-beta-xylosidase [Nocardiopsis terrae]GHC90987.1 xylan 1,4-beta-xylosidase [Nocardiopsis terrae]
MTTSSAAGVRAGTITNPVLPGFHPDPSVLRVGEDYYLATSTFEWSPGVLVHHSRDLVHWRPLGGILDRDRLLDLTGHRDGAGVWAPCLSHRDGVFHLIFTDVENYAGGFWDTPNYVTTARSVEGPWSDPVPIHSMGFDPSLFHDTDGRSWVLTNVMDWRPGREAFAGIVLQELDPERIRLLGEPRTVFEGTSARVTEAPHLYRENGWYYLVTAEGGTQWDHQVTVARSREITGPYEVDPAGPMLSSREHPSLGLQKAGHGSLVATPDGEWFLAHLASRPLTERGRCVRGRETALQRVEWVEGWPRVAGGVPREEVEGPALAPHPWPEAPARDDFDAPVLRPEWSTLRRHADEGWVSLAERPGHLRVRGGESPSGTRRPSLVARRVQHERCVLETVMEFSTDTFQRMAGLTAYYNMRQWHYLHVGFDEREGMFAGVLSSDRGRVREVGGRVDVRGWERFHLRAEIDGAELRFSLSRDGREWIGVGGVLDASILSDDYAAEKAADGETATVWGFTGAFLGLWVHDLTGTGCHADFDHATYQELTG